MQDLQINRAFHRNVSGDLLPLVPVMVDVKGERIGDGDD